MQDGSLRGELGRDRELVQAPQKRPAVTVLVSGVPEDPLGGPVPDGPDNRGYRFPRRCQRVTSGPATGPGSRRTSPRRSSSLSRCASMVGAMFAPDHQRAADEIVQATRPGGTVGLASWTPEGFIGQMFGVVTQHVPAPPGVASPLLWGTEQHLSGPFGPAAANARSVQRTFTWRFTSPEAFVSFFRRWYRPTLKAFEALDDTAVPRCPPAWPNWPATGTETAAAASPSPRPTWKPSSPSADIGPAMLTVAGIADRCEMIADEKMWARASLRTGGAARLRRACLPFSTGYPGPFGAVPGRRAPALATGPNSAPELSSSPASSLSGVLPVGVIQHHPDRVTWQGDICLIDRPASCASVAGAAAGASPGTRPSRRRCASRCAHSGGAAQ
jgi:hypothetical protein